MKPYLLIVILFCLVPRLVAGPKVGSLSLASDEIVYELLRRAERLEDLVAVSYLAAQERYSHIAKEVKNHRHIGSSPEALWALDADLWIGASYNQQVLLDVVKAKKQDLLMLSSFERLQDIRHHILEVGRATRTQAFAADLLKDFDAGLKNEALRCKTKPLKALFWSSNHVIPGQQTLVGDLLENLGVVNVVTHQGWQKIGPEALAMLRPDVVIATEPLSAVQSEPALRLLPAVQKKSIVEVKSRSVHAVSHHILVAYRELAEELSRLAVCGG